MSRYSDICEKTYSRWYRKSFDFKAFNEDLIFGEFPKDEECIAAIDASFISKSGKCTAGLGMFWNGSTGSAKKESIKTHLNASFTALNLMKIEDRKSKNTLSETIIYIASWKRRKFNEHLIHKVFSKLEIRLTDEKVKRAYDEMRKYGVIAA